MTDGDGAAARPETAVLMLAEDEALTVRVRREPGYVLVIVAGEVDFACVARLRALEMEITVTRRELMEVTRQYEDVVANYQEFLL